MQFRCLLSTGRVPLRCSWLLCVNSSTSTSSTSRCLDSLFVETVSARELPHFLWNNSDSCFQGWLGKTFSTINNIYVSSIFLSRTTFHFSLVILAAFQRIFRRYTFALHRPYHGTRECKNRNYTSFCALTCIHDCPGPITKISFDLDSTFCYPFQIFLGI